MRAMPSPTCSTVPTSERSVCTSYCSILDFRIWVISSGLSFKVLLFLSGCCQFSAQSLQATAHARVDAQRAGLEDEAAEQVGVDAARRVDGTAGGLLDLLHNLLRLLVAQLVRRRQVDRQP